MKKLMMLLVPFLMMSLVVMISCKDEEVDPVENCGNGIDDDGDGLVDCDDFDDCVGFDPCGFPSDLRIKEAIEPVGYGLDAILEMDPVRFKYTSSEIVHLGLIAQQLQDVMPEVIVDDPFSEYDVMAIRYEEIIPVLIKAIQEQQQMIDDLNCALDIAIE